MNSIKGYNYLLKENIENYKNKLLSSYWTEINLIGYKIELLEKQKVEYPKELDSRIIEIGNKISKYIFILVQTLSNLKKFFTRR